MLAGLIAVGGVSVYLVRGSDAPDPRQNRPPGGEVEADRRQPSVALDSGKRAETPAEEVAETRGEFAPHFIVFDARGEHPVPLLAIDEGAPDPGGLAHYCIPASLLPTDTGLFLRNGEPVPFTAVTWERRSHMVLLLGPKPRGIENFRPLPVRDAGSVSFEEPLTCVTPSGYEVAPIRLTRRGIPMFFDRRLEVGSVVVDAEQRAVAFVTNHGGLPIHHLAPWRNHFTGRPLADLQKEIRAADPRLTLKDAESLLDSKTITLENVEEALTKLRNGQHLARERSLIEAFDRLLRFAHHQRVRLLTRIDGVRALAQARDSLAILGDHPGLLSDAVLLALDHGDPSDAVRWFQSLKLQATGHATKIVNTLARKLRNEVLSRLQEQRVQDAARLIELAVTALPLRAELRLLYARTLDKLGNRAAARIQAAEAVRLDRSFTAKAHRYRTTEGTGTRSRNRVVIPFDPRDNQIRTSGNASGQPVAFVIDTGASYTTVPTSVARALGLLNRHNLKVKVHTANGTVEAVQIELPWLTIAGKITVTKVTAVVIDLPGALANKGLLGLNVLQRLNMQIDSRRSQLILWADRRRR